jgi:hypothetical protein
VRTVEEEGRNFHPLLATLITGAARLMLGLAERLATDARISWAFCDTDSMGLAEPDGMDDATFLDRARAVRDWFTPLNPYSAKGPVFKIEDANYRLAAGKVTAELQPLYAYPVSAKRYDLFNLDHQRGRPVLRKASAHGLGHLRPPYDEHHAPKSIPKPSVSFKDLGVDRWQYDVWYRIVQAALDGHPEQVRLNNLPSFDLPAVSRYAATTPALLRWFTRYNADKPYREQVKPFNFLLSFQARTTPHLDLGVVGAGPETRSAGEGRSAGTARRPRRRRRTQPGAESPHAVAPYDRDVAAATRRCFDRETGQPVAAERLQSYVEALAQYHLHPEAKFDHADYTDTGVTTRRHILATRIEHIGKEANRWEEQLYLGENPDAQIVYGAAPGDDADQVAAVVTACQAYGVRALARASGLSVGAISAIRDGRQLPTQRTVRQVQRAVEELEAARREDQDQTATVIAAARERAAQVGLGAFAREVGVNRATTARLFAGKRQASLGLMQKLEEAFSRRTAPLMHFDDENR